MATNTAKQGDPKQGDQCLTHGDQLMKLNVTIVHRDNISIFVM